MYEAGYEDGKAEQAREDQRLRDGLAELMRAVDAVENGDPGPLDELARQAAADDLLDVAEDAGVTPLAEVGFADELADEVEAWLRGQGSA
ncbi:hypothetical protein [Micromonospora sp. S4605]|uniref:hypothetical protein n=1 Tax=Micromonospora sp. S4605 TaxID=1420897 RepID=UPI000D6FD2A2|nr:hypothetical protein [Micromonospora sp. S4605]